MGWKLPVRPNITDETSHTAVGRCRLSSRPIIISESSTDDQLLLICVLAGDGATSANQLVGTRRWSALVYVQLSTPTFPQVPT